MKILYTILVLNIISLLMFACDKSKAINSRRRIPEFNLLFVSFFAPYGAYIGMKAWRHKTRKPIFSIGIPIFMVINLIILFLISK